MKRPSVLKIMLALAGGLAFLWGVWFIAVPASLLESAAAGELGKLGLDPRFKEFRKGFFLSVRADELVLKVPSLGDVAFIDPRVTLRPLSSLVSRKAVVDMRARLAGGSLQAHAEAGSDPREATAHMEITGAELAAFDIRELTGVEGSGTVDVELDVKGGSGTVKGSFRRLSLSPYEYMGFKIPIDLLREGRVMAGFQGQALDVKSLSLQGDGIYARAKGTVSRKAVDMTLELMPDKNVEQELPMLSLASRYKAPDGHYVFPLKKTFAL